MIVEIILAVLIILLTLVIRLQFKKISEKQSRELENHLKKRKNHDDF